MLISAEQVQLLGFNKSKRNIRFEKIIERIKKIAKCLNCGTNQPKFVLSMQDKTFQTVYKNKSDSISIPLTTHEILRLFDSIDDKDIETLGFNPKFIHPRNLIIQNLVVSIW